MTCMDLNLYVTGVAAAGVVGNAFWYLLWCKAVAQRNEMMALVQRYAEALIVEGDKQNE